MIWRWGSSPHTRGALVSASGSGNKDGIIPAYAGSTEKSGLAPPNTRDHPRIRGEHYGVRLAITSPRGSSPHTRGARHLDRRRLGRAGIIPAYAGSTRPAHRSRPGSGDHPRIRGEHWDGEIEVSDNEGSSPHTRGARIRALCLCERLGIIPAYAGSTSGRRTCCAARGDHPRIRGEHWPCEGQLEDEEGSSPHTRGARLDGVAAGAQGGIIPAYAGSTMGGRSL